jgi:2-keto-myo-inositol isomerase
MANLTFALNHMVAPALKLGDFIAAAQALGINKIEIRNDLAGNAILDGTTPAAVADLTARAGIEIISINALQRFNEWTPKREREARELVDYAAACGARALVLVPVNDGSGRADGERQQNVRYALEGLKPILEAAGIIGLVEPLGFGICSLSSKREAAEAIADVGGQGRFKLVHDTFHHHLAGEPELFPELTGLVHISGVEDPAVRVEDMLDAHRVMVGKSDRIDNVGQVRALRAAGYFGPFSFEPFADDVHANSDPVAMIGESIAHIEGAFRN